MSNNYLSIMFTKYKLSTMLIIIIIINYYLRLDNWSLFIKYSNFLVYYCYIIWIFKYCKYYINFLLFCLSILINNFNLLLYGSILQYIKYTDRVFSNLFDIFLNLFFSKLVLGIVYSNILFALNIKLTHIFYMLM